MRLAPCFLLPAAAAAVQASYGMLYIYDHQANNDLDLPAVSLKPDAARLVIASRLGLDQHHSLQGQSESALQDIDRLSGQSSFLSSTDASVALILTTADTGLPSTLVRSAHTESIQIRECPDFNSAEKLLTDLARQSGIDQLAHVQQSTVSSETGPAFRIAKDGLAFADAVETLINQYNTVLVLTAPKAATDNTFGSYAGLAQQKRYVKEAPLITEVTKTASHLKATLAPDAHSNKTYNQTAPL
ncbi:hypothetical protein E4T44_13596, partial [Aureobasidium sp. EXF-8845]